MMDQLLLDIQIPKVKSLENFIIGDNSETINIIKKFIADKSLQFFYLWGVEGSGKSHLSDVVKRGNIFVIEDIETKNNMEQVEAFNIFNDCKENSKKLFNNWGQLSKQHGFAG